MIMKSQRLRYFLFHVAISACLVGSAIALILLLWYPSPFAQLEGIYRILAVLAFVDVCAGPLCTLVAVSPGKPTRELRRDLAIIATIQLVALSYGLYTSFSARPVYVVYNVGVFELEHANELTAEEIAKVASPEFASIPLTGPRFVEGRFPEDKGEAMKIVQSATSGGPDIKDMPRYFVAWPYEDSEARSKGKPVLKLPETNPLRGKAMDLLKSAGVDPADALALLITGKVEPGTVVLKKSDLNIVGIIPYLAP